MSKTPYIGRVNAETGAKLVRKAIRSRRADAWVTGKGGVKLAKQIDAELKRRGFSFLGTRGGRGDAVRYYLEEIKVDRGAVPNREARVERLGRGSSPDNYFHIAVYESRF